MKTKTDITAETDLDALFAQARATPPEPSADFMARIEAQAHALQPRAPFAPARRPLGVWARLAAALGGAIALGGLGTAAMAAGLVIGYVQPEPMVNLAGSIGFGTAETIDLLPGFDALLTEDLAQ